MGQTSYITELSPKQKAFFDDPAKLKAAIPGRRSGKTWECIASLYEASRTHKRTFNPYICLTAVSARRIMWPVLKEFDERYQLGLKFHDHELIAELPENGSAIFCVGGDDARKVEALRGGKPARIRIDDAGSFPRALLRYLCEDVLDASLMDHDGDMSLVGTPNAACVGYFHDITTGKNPDVARVSTHHWTVLDNVHIPHAAEWLERKRLSKHWSVDNPVYQREYMGHWIRDTDSLVFRFDRARHMKESAAVPTWCVLGVDLGVKESEATTAFVVVGWNKHDRTTHALYAKKCARMNPETVGEEIAELMKKFPISLVVVDEGGLGKGYADMWRARGNLGVGVVAAEKREKLTYVEFLNAELDSGRMTLAEKAEPLAAELEMLQWDEDRKGYDDRFADHACDAFLYSWRACHAWSEANLPAVGPQPGSAAWELARHAALKEQALNQAERRARQTGKQLIRRYR